MSRSDRAYVFLAGLFIAALVACNLLVYKFFSFEIPSGVPLLGGLSFFGLSVGILPYPLTFLVTDLLSEIWGKRRANWVVVAGFFVSLFVLGFVELGASVKAITGRGWYGPVHPASTRASWTRPLELGLQDPDNPGSGARFRLVPDPPLSGVPVGDLVQALNAALGRAGAEGRLSFSWSEVWHRDLLGRTGDRRLRLDDYGHGPPPLLRLKAGPGLAPLLPKARNLPARILPASPVGDDLFLRVFGGTFRAILASMVAYLCAQWFDIQIFHFWKRVTKGKHLWLRNNGSTILSQFLDTTLVVTILFLGSENEARIPAMILAGWKFKALVALADTPFFYLGVWTCRRLGLAPPGKETNDHPRVEEGEGSG